MSYAALRTTVLRLSVLLAATLASAPSAQATTLIVPDQAPTIQQAIDAVVDTIVVRPGTYPETLVVRQQFSLMTASDDAGGPPEIGGLDFTGDGSLLYEFRGLEFTSNLLIVGAYRLKFADCIMPRINSTVVSSWLLRCSTSEHSGTDATETAIVDSCHLVGGITSDSDYFIVRGCVVGPGHGISSFSENVLIDGNTIRGTIGGVTLDNSYNSIVTNNLIENCAQVGIYDSGHDLKTITNNVIRNCRGGMQFENGRIFITGNTVSGSEYGIYIMSSRPVVEWNVVTGSRYYGIGYSGASPGVKIKNNTVAFNGYGGINVDDYNDGDECIGNIGYRNGGYGVDWEVSPGATFACNNWFENGFGPAADRELFATEFSVDPQFCDPDSGDYYLQSDSPLVNWPGCGQVGALGIGCGSTATTVLRFTAERAHAGVRIAWKLGPGSTASDVWLERAANSEGESWIRPVTEQSIEADAIVELDRSAASDIEYRYRLMAREGTDVAVIGSEIKVDAIAKPGFELISVGPSPGVGPVRVAFSLARSGPIAVDVFDVLGRSVATPARGTWPAGLHQVEWNGLVRGEKARPGLYLIRYAHPGGQNTRRVIRIP